MAEEELAIVACEETRNEQELISLKLVDDDKQWELSFGDGIQSFETMAMADIPRQLFVHSFIGNTSAGKSLILRHLMSEKERDSGPLVLDDSEQDRSTTANINGYVTSTITSENTTTLMLDYEGEKGSFPMSLIPYFLTRRINYLSFQQLRRDAVTNYFPKLSYVLSNVVVIVGVESLVGAVYIDRCWEFAHAANNGIQDVPYFPALIIIQNRCSLKKKFDSEIVTKEFFGVHGETAKRLFRYFSRIHCFRLPDIDYSLRIGGVRVDGKEVFTEQIDRLRQLLNVIHREHIKKGQILTYYQWLYLMKRSLEIVGQGKTFSLHLMMSEILSAGKVDDTSIVMRMFLRVYAEMKEHSPNIFIQCCRFALRALAILTAHNVLKLEANARAQGADANNESSLFIGEPALRTQCQIRLDALLKDLLKYQPCSAKYEGPGIVSTTEPQSIFCYQHQGNHRSHRTTKEVYMPNSDLIEVLKEEGFSWRSLKKGFGWFFFDEWEGDFQKLPNNEEHEMQTWNLRFFGLVKSYRDQFLQSESSDREVYIAFTRLLQQYKSVTGNVEPCRWICFCGKHEQIIQDDSNPLHEKRTGKKHKKRLIRVDDSITCNKCFDQCKLRVSEYPDKYQVEPFPRECIICCGCQFEFALMPCGHRGFCEKCSHEMLKTGQCPVCRENINAVQRVYDV